VGSKVQQLEEKARQIAEQLQRARAKEAHDERKADTKRKVLLGAMVHAWIQEDDEIKAKVMARMEKFLTRNSDRRYFGMTLIKDTDARAKAHGATGSTKTAAHRADAT